MNRYEVKKETTNNNYGIYDYLSSKNCMLNLGVIGENRYCFDIGITSIEGKKYELERTTGDYLFDISIKKENDIQVLTINYVDREDNQDINMFQYYTLLGVINEGVKYIETGKDLVIKAPGILFKDKKDRVLDTKASNFVMDINYAIMEIEDNKNIKEKMENTDEEETDHKVFRLFPFKRNK